MAFKEIKKQELKVGMYVDLGLSWFDHPFATSKFKIDDDMALHEILAIAKLKTLQWDPDKSDSIREALPVEEARKQFIAKKKRKKIVDPIPEPEITELQAEDRQKLKESRAALNQVDKNVRELHAQTKKLAGKLSIGNQEALDSARKLANIVTEDLATHPNAAMQLINCSIDESSSFGRHAINVTAMSVMLARAAGLKDKQVRDVGMGAFLHDIGLTRLPTHISMKHLANGRGVVFLQNSSDQGARIGVEKRPGASAQAIAFHHEMPTARAIPRDDWRTDTAPRPHRGDR